MEEEILRKPDLAQDKLHARMRQVSSEGVHQIGNCSSVCEHAGACSRRAARLRAPAVALQLANSRGSRNVNTRSPRRTTSCTPARRPSLSLKFFPSIPDKLIFLWFFFVFFSN